MTLKQTSITLAIGICCLVSWLCVCYLGDSSTIIISHYLRGTFINILCRVCRAFIHSQKQIQLHFMWSLSTWLKSIYEEVTVLQEFNIFCFIRMLIPISLASTNEQTNQQRKKTTKNSCEKSSCVKSVKQRTCYSFPHRVGVV